MKNASELRDKMIELFDKVQSEQINLHAVKEQNRTAATIISSARAELQYQVAKGDVPSIPFLES